MRLLFSTLALSLFVSAFAQDQPTFEKKPFRDSEGNLFWPLSLPVYVHLSSSPNSAEGVVLSEVKDRVQPMKWDGHGKHYIKHEDKKQATQGESAVAFPVNVDGIAPVSLLELQGASRYAADKVSFGKGLTVFAKAKDEMSGLEDIYISINKAPFSKLTSPITISDEKEYHIQYFAVDKVGNVEPTRLASFSVDLTPPMSSHEVSGSHLDGKILSPRAFISIAARDEISGVKKTEYYFDGQKPVPYSSGIPLTGLTDGEHTLTYYSVDHVGNIESPKKYAFYMDSKGPEVKSSFDANFAVSDGRYYATSSTLVSLEATDNKSGVKQVFYSINGSAEQIYSSPFSLPSKAGTYSIRYRAIDNLDNAGITFTDKQISAIYIDNTPPIVTHSVSTPKIYTRDTLFVTEKSIFTIKSFDAEAGGAIVDYRLDNGDEITYEEPFKVSLEGKHAMSYTGTDLINNSAVKTAFFVVDNSGPQIFMHTSLEKIGTQKLLAKEQEIPIYASGTSFYMAATDNSVGTKAIYYSLNQQAEVLYTQPVKFVTKGVHLMKIRAVDYLGNERLLEAIEFAVQ